MTNLLFLGSKITVDGNHSHEIRRHLLLGIKSMTILDSVLKIKDIILLTNIPIVKTIVFPEAMYSCESWTLKKAECQRIDAFELWCCRRLRRRRLTLDSKVIKSVNLKGNQPCVLVGRTDAKAQTPVFWSSDTNN